MLRAQAPGKNKPGIGAHGAPFFGSSNPKTEEPKTGEFTYSNYSVKHYKNEETYNAFDSLKLQMPLANVAVDLKKFYSCNQYQSLYRLKDQYKPVGLTSAEVSTQFNTFTFAFSSKLLRANCMDLINATTLPTIHQALTSSGAFTCDYSALLEAMVLRADVTQNCYCRKPSELIQALCGHSSQEYRVQDPHRNRQGYFTSLEFHRQAKTKQNKLRVIVYNKQDEVYKDTAFTSQLTQEEQTHLHTQAQHQLRIEANLKTFKSIRKILNIDSNNLEKVIFSSNKAIHQIMQTITSKRQTLPKGINVDPTQLTAKELTYLLVLEGLQFNLEVLRAKYKAADPKNVSRLMEPYHKFIEKYSGSQTLSPVTALLDSLQAN